MAYIVDPSGFKVTHLPSRIQMRILPIDKKNKKQEIPTVKVEDWSILDECKKPQDSPYVNQGINIIVSFPSCTKDVDFTIDMDATIDTIELTNVYDFTFCINGELQSFDTESVYIYKGDTIHISIERDNLYEESEITIRCLNPHVIIDSRDNPESSLDEPTDIDIVV